MSEPNDPSTPPQSPRLLGSRRNGDYSPSSTPAVRRYHPKRRRMTNKDHVHSADQHSERRPDPHHQYSPRRSLYGFDIHSSDTPEYKDAPPVPAAPALQPLSSLSRDALMLNCAGESVVCASWAATSDIVAIVTRVTVHEGGSAVSEPATDAHDADARLSVLTAEGAVPVGGSELDEGCGSSIVPPLAPQEPPGEPVDPSPSAADNDEPGEMTEAEYAAMAAKWGDFVDPFASDSEPDEADAAQEAPLPADSLSRREDAGLRVSDAEDAYVLTVRSARGDVLFRTELARLGEDGAEEGRGWGGGGGEEEERGRVVVGGQVFSQEAVSGGCVYVPEGSHRACEEDDPAREGAGLSTCAWLARGGALRLREGEGRLRAAADVTEEADGDCACGHPLLRVREAPSIKRALAGGRHRANMHELVHGLAADEARGGPADDEDEDEDGAGEYVDGVLVPRMHYPAALAQTPLVTALAWRPDARLLAVGLRSGAVAVFSVVEDARGPQGLQYWFSAGAGPVKALAWQQVDGAADASAGEAGLGAMVAALADPADGGVLPLPTAQPPLLDCPLPPLLPIAHKQALAAVRARLVQPSLPEALPAGALGVPQHWACSDRPASVLCVCTAPALPLDKCSEQPLAGGAETGGAPPAVVPDAAMADEDRPVAAPGDEPGEMTETEYAAMAAQWGDYVDPFASDSEPDEADAASAPAPAPVPASPSDGALSGVPAASPLLTVSLFAHGWMNVGAVQVPQSLFLRPPRPAPLADADDAALALAARFQHAAPSSVAMHIDPMAQALKLSLGAPLLHNPAPCTSAATHAHVAAAQLAYPLPLKHVASQGAAARALAGAEEAIFHLYHNLRAVQHRWATAHGAVTRKWGFLRDDLLDAFNNTRSVGLADVVGGAAEEDEDAGDAMEDEPQYEPEAPPLDASVGDMFGLFGGDDDDEGDDMVGGELEQEAVKPAVATAGGDSNSSAASVSEDSASPTAAAQCLCGLATCRATADPADKWWLLRRELLTALFVGPTYPSVAVYLAQYSDLKGMERLIDGVEGTLAEALDIMHDKVLPAAERLVWWMSQLAAARAASPFAALHQDDESLSPQSLAPLLAALWGLTEWLSAAQAQFQHFCCFWRGFALVVQSAEQPDADAMCGKGFRMMQLMDLVSARAWVCNFMDGEGGVIGAWFRKWDSDALINTESSFESLGKPSQGCLHACPLAFGAVFHQQQLRSRREAMDNDAYAFLPLSWLEGEDGEQSQLLGVNAMQGLPEAKQASDSADATLTWFSVRSLARAASQRTRAAVAPILAQLLRPQGVFTLLAGAAQQCRLHVADARAVGDAAVRIHAAAEWMRQGQSLTADAGAVTSMARKPRLRPARSIDEKGLARILQSRAGDVEASEEDAAAVSRSVGLAALASSYAIPASVGVTELLDAPATGPSPGLPLLPLIPPAAEPARVDLSAIVACSAVARHPLLARQRLELSDDLLDSVLLLPMDLDAVYADGAAPVFSESLTAVLTSPSTVVVAYDAPALTAAGTRVGSYVVSLHLDFSPEKHPQRDAGPRLPSAATIASLAVMAPTQLAVSLRHCRCLTPCLGLCAAPTHAELRVVDLLPLLKRRIPSNSSSSSSSSSSLNIPSCWTVSFRPDTAVSLLHAAVARAPCSGEQAGGDTADTQAAACVSVMGGEDEDMIDNEEAVAEIEAEEAAENSRQLAMEALITALHAGADLTHALLLAAPTGLPAPTIESTAANIWSTRQFYGAPLYPVEDQDCVGHSLPLSAETSSASSFSTLQAAVGAQRGRALLFSRHTPLYAHGHALHAYSLASARGYRRWRARVEGSRTELGRGGASVVVAVGVPGTGDEADGVATESGVCVGVDLQL